MNFRTAWSAQPRLPDVERKKPEFSSFEAAMDAMRKAARVECTEAGMTSPIKPERTTGVDVLSDRREEIAEKLRAIGEEKRRQRCEQIHAILGRNGAMSCEEVADKIAMSQSTTRKSLNILIAEGRVSRRDRKGPGVIMWMYSVREGATNEQLGRKAGRGSAW